MTRIVSWLNHNFRLPPIALIKCPQKMNSTAVAFYDGYILKNPIVCCIENLLRIVFHANGYS